MMRLVIPIVSVPFQAMLTGRFDDGSQVHYERVERLGRKRKLETLVDL
jgi:hypothetical protein